MTIKQLDINNNNKLASQNRMNPGTQISLPFSQKISMHRYDQHSSLHHNNSNINTHNHMGIKTSLTNRNNNFHLTHNFYPHAGQYHTLDHAHSQSCSHGSNHRESANLGEGTPIFIRKNLNFFDNQNGMNQISIPNMLFNDKNKKNINNHQQPNSEEKINNIIDVSNIDPNVYVPPTPSQSTTKPRADSPYKPLFVPSMTSSIPSTNLQTGQPFTSPPSPTRIKSNLFSNSIYLDYNATMPLNKPTNSALFQSPNLLRLVKNKTTTSNIMSNNSEFSEGNRGRKRCSHSETKRNKYITVVSRMPVKKNIILQLHS